MFNNISYLLSHYLSERKTKIDSSILYILGSPLSLALENTFENPIFYQRNYFSFLNTNFLGDLASLTNSYFDIHLNNDFEVLCRFLGEEKSTIIILSDKILDNEKEQKLSEKYQSPLACLINNLSVNRKKINPEDPSCQNILVNLILGKKYTFHATLSEVYHAWNITGSNYFRANYLYYAYPIYSDEFNFARLLNIAIEKQRVTLNSKTSGYIILKEYKDKVLKQKRMDTVYPLLDYLLIPIRKYARLKIEDMGRGEYANSLLENLDLLPLKIEKMILPLQKSAKAWEQLLYISKDENIYTNIFCFLEMLENVIECENEIVQIFNRVK